MIRPAKFNDIPRIVELMKEMHKRSKYVDRDTVDEKMAHQLVAQCVQRHGHIHDGGALVMVALNDQRIEGFLIGMLDRVYHIGKRLCANDIFLYCSDLAKGTSALQLFSAYVSWATHNPKVVEIKASWTDSIEGADRMAKVYERGGFRKCGEIFERLIEEPQDDPARVLEGVVK